jgi:hypothetical protein
VANQVGGAVGNHRRAEYRLGIVGGGREFIAAVLAFWPALEWERLVSGAGPDYPLQSGRNAQVA